MWLRVVEIRICNTDAGTGFQPLCDRPHGFGARWQRCGSMYKAKTIRGLARKADQRSPINGWNNL